MANATHRTDLRLQTKLTNRRATSRNNADPASWISTTNSSPKPANFLHVNLKSPVGSSSLQTVNKPLVDRSWRRHFSRFDLCRRIGERHEPEGGKELKVKGQRLKVGHTIAPNPTPHQPCLQARYLCGVKRLITLLIFCGVLTSQAQIRVAKVNVAGAAFYTPGIAFEKVRNKQFSWLIAASYRFPVSSQSALLNPILAERQYIDFQAKGWSVTGEYRFYTERARRDPTKPYISGFVRYYDMEGDFDFAEDGEPFNLDASLSTITVGFQYGTQWVFRDKWSIDWTFFGVGYSRSYWQGAMHTDHPDPNIGLLEDDFLTIPALGSRFNFKGTEGFYTMEERFGTLGFRTSLCVGFLF